MLSLVVTFFAVAEGQQEGAAPAGEMKSASPPEPTDPNECGMITMALQGDPVTLDGQVSTSNIVNIITQHIYEKLLAFNWESIPQPMLAESVDIQNDGLKYVFTLRKGIKFHNGTDMTAEDVIASIERWMKVSDRGRQVDSYVDSLTAPDQYTVVFSLNKPFSELTTFLALANSGAYIMPKEIVGGADEQPVKEFIGTGPFQLDRWEVGNYVHLTRYNGYKPVSQAHDKTAGEKKAWADSVRFVTVPEETTRLSGVKSGKYHVALSISYDMYGSLLQDSKVRVEVAEGSLAPVFFFNHKQGIMTNKTMRQAVLAALDMKSIMQGTFGNEDLYFLGPNFSFTKDSIWYSDAGSEYYNQANPAKAKELLKEAGYNNEQIVWIAPTGYPEIYWPTVIGAEQLMNAGFNIKMEVIEAATFFGTTRPDPEQWDMFSTYHGWVASPAQWTVLSPSYPGWWENNEKNRLLEKYFATFDIDDRADVWAEIQQLIWSEAAVARTGTTHSFMVTVPELGGFEGMLQPILWNCWLEE